MCALGSLLARGQVLACVCVRVCACVAGRLESYARPWGALKESLSA